MRLYVETSVLGAVTDREDPRRVAITRSLLRALAVGDHEGVISNGVQEELELAPVDLREEILHEIRAIEFELAMEDAASRALFAAYQAVRIIPAKFRNDLRHVAVATTVR